ncbi:methyl-accepting chemotaxis protein [Burkholderia cepacia]|uniref:methyl-accepting chemotaxis protein n=1 Tax=Burkholderia cepacia TaxID=292 RepID=UPI002AB6B761|nr:methyl-accepting chemotaxis protein [Burkholderia cepacia]
MTIRYRALAVLGLLAAVFLAGTLSSSWFLLQSNNALTNVQREIRVVLSVIDPINHSRTMRVFLSQSMMARDAGRMDEAKTALGNAQSALDKSQRVFQSYMDREKQPEEKQLADMFRNTYQMYLNQGLLPMMQTATNGDKERFEQLVTTTVPVLDRQFEIAVNDLLAFREQYARRLNDNAQTNFAISLTALAVSSALFVATLVLIFVWLRGTLLRTLDEAVGHCANIAQGNLRNCIVSRSNDEIGAMVLTLEEMRKSLAATVARVLGASQSVAHGSKEIAAGNLDLSARTEQQAASLEETAASMTELTHTTRQNAENALQASTLASEAADIAARSDEAVKAMVSTAAEIGRESIKIADITGLIEGISFQTNILALNAAVEAARAGDQGRGFAVVASEVRSLAQRSNAAAKEIKKLIDNSVVLAHKGTEQAESVGDSMDQVAGAIKRVRDIIGEIAVASSEQARGIEQVNEAVGQMDRVTQENAALVEQSAAAAQSLDQQAKTLNQSVSLFQIESN